jgi:intergrase/recombinase
VFDGFELKANNGNRNNEDRFADPRLEWTRHVPNSFYVFSLRDPKAKKELIKFGRTQHLDVWKRYPAKERREYSMSLLLNLRGKLEVTTKIENWWKSQAEEHDYFVR